MGPVPAAPCDGPQPTLRFWGYKLAIETKQANKKTAKALCEKHPMQSFVIFSYLVFERGYMCEVAHVEVRG